MNPKRHLLQKLKKRRRSSETHAFPKPALSLLIAGAILITGILVFYASKAVIRESDIAAYLPSEETIAFVQWEDFSLPLKMRNETAWIQGAENWMKSAFGVRPSQISEKWHQKSFGLIALTADQHVEPVLFLETQGEGAIKKMEEAGLLIPGENTISGEGGSRVSFYFSDPYIFISKNPAVLDRLNSPSEEEMLKNSLEYQKSLSHLPRGAWIRAYAHPQSLAAVSSESVKGMLEPLALSVKQMALTVRKTNEGFHFNTLTSTDKGFLRLESQDSPAPTLSYGLARYLDQGQALYLGGGNLAEEWQNTLRSLAGMNPGYGILLESLVRAQADRVFGEGVDLRNDLYPLFEGEYAFSLSQTETGSRSYQLILTHNDAPFAETKLRKLMEGFAFMAGRFSPQVVTVPLPDGTESREMVANQDLEEEKAQEHLGQMVHCLESEPEKGFCYTIADDWLAIGTSKEQLKKAIELSQSSGDSLADSPSFRQSVSHLSKVSDEIGFANFAPLTASFKNHPLAILLQPLLEPLQSATWVKHVFDDGVSAEGFVSLR